MNQAKATKTIFSRWISRWNAEVTKVAAMPQGFTGPTPVKFAFDNDVRPLEQYFARVGILSLESTQGTLGPIGNRKYHRPGYIQVRLNGKPNEGRENLDLLVVAVREVFEGLRFGESVRDHGITTHASSVSELARDPDAAQLWILTVITPFEFYERR